MVVCPSDPNSFTNSDQAVIKHSHLDWTTNFEKKILQGSVIHTIAILEPTTKIVLDTKSLSISQIKMVDDNTPLEYSFGTKDDQFGTPLTIEFGKTMDHGAQVKVQIFYETTDGCTAIQWLAPSQTVGKVHPYLFTQCQGILERDNLICSNPCS